MHHFTHDHCYLYGKVECTRAKSGNLPQTDEYAKDSGKSTKRADIKGQSPAMTTLCLKYMQIKRFILCLLCCGGTSVAMLAQEKTVLHDSIPEVVVTGTGTQHYLKDAPVRTEVINRKMLEAYAGNSLEDILSALAASFDFNTNDMGSGIQMGGLGNGYILILVDGKKMHGDVGGQINLSRINPTNIERIELVKGAASSLYGSDAIAGVIHIITKKHKERLLVENTSRVGSYAEIRQSNTFQISASKLTAVTDFHLKHSDGWQNTTHENPNRYEKPITNSVNKTVNRNTSWSIGQQLRYTVSPHLNLYTEGTWYQKRIYRPMGIPDFRTYDLSYRDINAALGGELKLGKSNRITADLLFDSHAYYYDYTFQTDVDEFDDNGKRKFYTYYAGDRSLQSNQSRLSFQSKGVFQLPALHRLSVGMDAQYDWLKAPYRLDKEQVADYTGALYLQDEWMLSDALNITAGLRLTGHKDFGMRITPKISVLYKTGKFGVRAGYSQGFKTPTLKELHYRYISPMGSMVSLNVGNSALKPQNSHYISLGGEYNGSKFSISVTGYFNKLNNMIALVTVPLTEAPKEYLIAYQPGRVRKYHNMNDARIFGADVEWKWQLLRNFSIGGSYSYLDTRANEYDDEDGIMKRITIDGMAHHRATFNALWQKEWRNYKLHVSLNGRMQSKRYYQNDGDGKAYMIWRLNTRHRMPNIGQWAWEINAGIDNILNYYETTPHGLHYGTNTPGRTVYASMMFRLGKSKKTTMKPIINPQTED